MRKKLTNHEFICKSDKVHNNKYDYSFTKYINNKTKVKIICPIHGVFEQIPYNHLNGNGCPKCSFDNKKINTKTFIKRSNFIHKNKYDYSLVEYESINKKVKIICPIHGIFEQSPKLHMNCKNACPLCNKMTTIDFIKRSKNIYGNRYDYSLVDYKNAYTKVKIICKEHGIFEQIPNNHITGKGCKYCMVDSNRLDISDFINRSNKIHNNKYDYSFTKYINNKTKVKIICPIHGVFKQMPSLHMCGQGCKKCSNNSIRLKIIKRIEENKLNGHQLVPNFNKDACKLFDKISEEKEIYIQHAMNGGEFYIKELGYWVDGYDKENNIVYEYDEKHHKYQKEKDNIRQKEIEQHLNCKFIRIKE